MQLAIASLIKQVVRVGVAAPQVFQLQILVCVDLGYDPLWLAE